MDSLFQGGGLTHFPLFPYGHIQCLEPFRKLLVGLTGWYKKGLRLFPSILDDNKRDNVESAGIEASPGITCQVSLKHFVIFGALAK